MGRTATILFLGIAGGEILNPQHEIRNKSPLGGIKNPNVSNRKNFCILIFNEVVKSPKIGFSVTPVKTGIQSFQWVSCPA
jgi:hypothetical protein